jgi:hypothetical protein
MKHWERIRKTIWKTLLNLEKNIYMKYIFIQNVEPKNIYIQMRHPKPQSC